MYVHIYYVSVSSYFLISTVFCNGVKEGAPSCIMFYRSSSRILETIRRDSLNLSVPYKMLKLRSGVTSFWWRFSRKNFTHGGSRAARKD